MNYEEKYNEILEWARKNKARLNGVPIEEVLPELAESEDERALRIIRKRMCYDPVPISDEDRRIVENWLEKQKEQKPVHFELKAGKWYICHRAFCCRADHLTVKEGERFQCEKDGIVKGFVIKEPEKYFKECSAPAPMEDEDIITVHLGRVVSVEVYAQIVKDIVRLLERKYPSDANWYLDS